MKTNPNDPINSVIVNGHGDSGLTKREYFAAMAMQGVLANPTTVASYTIKDTNDLAEVCLKLTEALITELNKEQK